MIAQFTIGFKPQNLWSSLAAIDFFLGGTGAGIFLVSMSLGIDVGASIGVVAVILGALALLADLGRPERFWRAGSKVVVSWISRGAVFTAVFVAFGVLYVLPDWITALPWSRGTTLGQGFGIVAAVGAVGVMMYTGFLLSHSPSIPFWNTTLLPLLFASSALTCGAGTFFIMLPVLDEAALDIRTLEALGIVLLAVNLVFLGVYMLSMNSSTIAAKESVRLLVRGSLAATFLMGAIAVGLVIPLVVTAIVYYVGLGFGVTSSVLAIVGVLVLVGGYLFRHCILKAGVYAPIITF